MNRTHLLSSALLVGALLGVCGTAFAEVGRRSYVLPDGSVAIIGNDGMAAFLSGINTIVARERPGLRFTMTLKGSSTALPALAAGASLIAPLARDPWRGERAGFRQIHGHEPTAIRVGYSGWGPRANGKTPPAVYVNAANQMRAIPLEDLRRVFCAGAERGDLNLWSQLGVTGTSGGRRIHLYGLRDDGGSATAFRTKFLGELPYAVHYEPLDSNAAVIRAVAEDPYGIGIAGWVKADEAGDRVRILGISAQKKAAALPSRADVAAGLYPLSLPVQLLVDKQKDTPLDPLVKFYLRVALSDEGQTLLDAEAGGENGYLPLDPADLAEERAKLDAL